MYVLLSLIRTWNKKPCLVPRTRQPAYSVFIFLRANWLFHHGQETPLFQNLHFLVLSWWEMRTTTTISMPCANCLFPFFLIDIFETNPKNRQEKSGQENENIFILLSTFSHGMRSCLLFHFFFLLKLKDGWMDVSVLMNKELFCCWSEWVEGSERNSNKMVGVSEAFCSSVW